MTATARKRYSLVLAALASIAWDGYARPSGASDKLSGVSAPPLADARIGEWAEYGTSDGHRLRVGVTAIEGDRVVIRVEVYDGVGRPLGLPTRLRVAADDDRSVPPAPLKAAVSRAADTLPLAGHRLSAVKTTSRYRLAGHQIQRTVWTSDRVAVWGVVRQEERIDGQPSGHVELLRWGRQGHSARTKAR